MFESVVPETFQARSRKLLYETLPLSVGVHAAAFAIAVIGAAYTVAFPTHSPNVTAAYSLTSLPDPPPPPPPPPKVAEAAPAPVAQHVALPPPPPPQQVLEMAPRMIPDLVPKTIAPPPPALPVAKETVANGAPNGSAEGKEDGKIGGQIGGHKGGLAGSLVFPDDGRVYIERDAKLPLVVLQQDYPSYPDAARKKGEEDSVLLRYVIGTNGHVKEVTILDHAKNPVFDKSAIEAISEWRFRPLIRDGKPVEVVHELTVFYQIVAR